MDVPLLLLANKQDSSESLSAGEIRESYEAWWQAKLKSVSTDVTRISQERVASLQVIGISALNGYVGGFLSLLVGNILLTYASEKGRHKRSNRLAFLKSAKYESSLSYSPVISKKYYQKINE